MAVTVESLISSMMSNPDVLVVGAAIGFIFAKALGMRRNRMGGMGGGF